MWKTDIIMERERILWQLIHVGSANNHVSVTHVVPQGKNQSVSVRYAKFSLSLYIWSLGLGLIMPD